MKASTKQRGRPPKKKIMSTESRTLVRNQTSIPFFTWLNNQIKILTGKLRKTSWYKDTQRGGIIPSSMIVPLKYPVITVVALVHEI